MKPRNKKISFQSLWLGLRFVIPLTVALTLLAYAVMPLVEKLNLRWFVRDLDSRAQLITSTLQEPLVELLKQGDKTKINNLFARAIKDERLFAAGYCNEEGTVLYRTPTFPNDLTCKSPAVASPESRSL
ncbi:MAG: trehalose-6-phosphate synthase, partial [Smithellaceae bacterium]